MPIPPRLLLLCLACFGCSTAPGLPMTLAPSAAEQASVSLFPADAAVLPDEGIARILEASPRLPDRFQVVLLHIEHRSAGRFWGFDRFWMAILPATHQGLTDKVAAALGTSGRIAGSTDLPTFLLPEKPAAGQLREAAARFQADGVFVYRTDCQAYPRYRFWRNDQVKAFCQAEAVLLDVRSGLVPFTGRALRDFTVDLSYAKDFSETLREAETAAFSGALEDTALQLVRRLEGAR
jgi:hypothetical protein